MTFDTRMFNRFANTHIATERMLIEIRKMPSIESFLRDKTRPHIEFLFDRNKKTALMVKTVVATKGPAKNKEDLYKMNTTIAVGKSAVNNFFAEEEFKDFTLAVFSGNFWHECCIFLRKHDSGLQAIYYNPNYSLKTMGTQSNAVSGNFLKKWGNALTNIRSYCSNTGNIEGNCVGFVWEQVFELLFKGVSPFTSPKINLIPYNRYMTETSYKRHKHPNAPDEKDDLLPDHPVWVQVDEMLRGRSESDVDRIYDKLMCQGIVKTNSI